MKRGDSNMRTGTIFARGSCSALKWMALVGMVFALGSAQAAAQPTVASGDVEYVSTSTSTTVTVEVTDTTNTGVAHPVTGNPNLTDFQMPSGTNPTGVSISGNVITLTFAGSTTGTPAFTYTQPADTRRQITSVATGAALANVSETATAKDVPPVFSVAGPDLEVRVNVAFTAAAGALPRATGGNGTITYTVSPTLPAGLALNQPASATAAPNITGTATAMTSGARNFQLAAADGDGNTAIGDIATVNFTITVGDVPATPAVSAVRATGSMQALVEWNEPATNNSPITVYNLQYRATGGQWTNAGSNLPPSSTRATVTFPAVGTYSVRVQASNSFGASLWSAGMSVTVTAAASLVPPVLTTTAYTSRVGMAISPITLPATTGGFSPLTYSVSGQPAGLIFTAAATGGGMLAGTPTAVTTGAQTVTYMVTDSDTPAAQVQATFTYTVTDVPGAPTGLAITPTASSTTLDVSWTAPAILNNLPITGYDLEYMPTGGTAWTRMTTTTTTAVITVPVAGSYDVRVRANNTDGPSGWLSGTGSTALAPSTTLADVISIKPSDAEEHRIGGVKRLHVDEGDYIDVTVTLEWTVEQLREIYAASATPAPIYIDLEAHVESAAGWLSPAEVTNTPNPGQQDLPDSFESFPINIPKKPAASARNRDTERAEGTISLPLLEDDDAEDEGFRLRIGSGSDGVSLDPGRSKLESDIIVIDDDETQKITLKQSSTGIIYEGADVEFEVSADPELVDLQIDVRFDLTDADGGSVPSRAFGLSPASGSIGAGDDKLEVTMDLEDNDGNRDDEKLTLHAEIVSRDRDDIDDVSLDLMVFDVHRLPLLDVSPKTGTVAEGGEVELTLTLNRNPMDTRAIDPETRRYTSEAIDVTVMADESNVEIMPRPVKFEKYTRKAGDDWKQEMTVTVMPKVNDDIDGDRDLVLNAEVAGTVAGNGMGKESYDAVSTLMVTDGTEPLVWARSVEEVEAAVMAAKKLGMGDDMVFTAGEMIELEGNDLFGSAQGVSVGYTAMVDGDAVSESVSGGVVTITADSMGMAKVTIAARASRPSGAVTINDQTDPREASITIALEVGLEALSIMLEGPEDMNLVEGGMGGMVTATANRAVTATVTINLMRDRAMSSADDMDYTAEAITIEAGMMSGTTMVMAVEDDMMENEGNMPEELVLYGMAADNAAEVMGEVKFYIWDAAVPALPVIAQLLLAGVLGIGGYRRYRRR